MESTPKFIQAETLQDSSVLSIGRSFRLSDQSSGETMVGPSPLELVNLFPEHTRPIVPVDQKESATSRGPGETTLSPLPLFGFDRERLRQAFDNNTFQSPI